jgi:4-oxalocrotonate tautomerase
VPLIQVQLIEEILTPTQKKEIVSPRTDAMVSIEGENTWVDIGEVLNDEWDIGGPAVTTDAIRALVAAE